MAYTNEALGKALEDLTAAYQHFLDKAKDAAMAALSGTVIAQIKQDAKEHIASELAAQKSALEKAIETAKIALRNSAIEADTTLKQAAEAKKSELAALITAAENTLNEKRSAVENALNEKGSAVLQEIKTVSEKERAHLEKIKETIITEYKKKSKSYTDSMLIKIFQNGYVQWPGMPTPDTLFTFEGYRWSEVGYDGCFFRAKGKDANPFDGDEQGDAIRNISGYFEQFPLLTGGGCFTVAQANLLASGGGGWASGAVSFNASNVVPTAEENRPRNRTFIIWQLKKI